MPPADLPAADAAPLEKRDTREVILDAAERVIEREGARRLTIDAVVKQSGFSKGGVLYNFPSKQALIEGMVRRMIETAKADFTEAREAALARGEALMPAMVMAAFKRREKSQKLSMGLLAAVAEQPELLDPVRDFLAELRESFIANSTDALNARIAFFALDGMHFNSMFGLCELTDAERAALEARMLELVSEPRS